MFYHKQTAQKNDKCCRIKDDYHLSEHIFAINKPILNRSNEMHENYHNVKHIFMKKNGSDSFYQGIATCSSSQYNSVSIAIIHVLSKEKFNRNTDVYIRASVLITLFLCTLLQHIYSNQDTYYFKNSIMIN